MSMPPKRATAPTIAVTSSSSVTSQVTARLRRSGTSRRATGVLLEGGGVAADQRHVRTVAREVVAHHAADPLRGAGHDRDLSPERALFAHAVASFRFVVDRLGPG
jgi:hypothetical protein